MPNEACKVGRNASVEPVSTEYPSCIVNTKAFAAAAYAGLVMLLVEVVSASSYLTPKTTLSGIPFQSVSKLNWMNA